MSLNSFLFKSEFKQLSGKKMGNLLFLFSIYFFALFFIGTSFGVMTYLKEKMDDPFVNIVSSEVQMSYCDPTLMEGFFDGADSLKDKYGIDAVDFYKVDYENFSDGPASELNEVLKVGVLDDGDHAIWQMILSKPEVFVSDPKNNFLFNGYEQLLVLSEESAEMLNLTDDSSVFWRYSSLSGANRVELLVCAVLKIIPGDLDAIMSKDLYEFLQAGGAAPGYRDLAYLSQNAAESTDTAGFTTVEPAPLYAGGFIVSGGGGKEHDIIKDLPKLKLLSIAGASTSLDQNGVCFKFNNLEKVRPFSIFLKNERGKYYCSDSRGALEIDLDTIEAKENLDLFNKFGVLLAIALSLVSIVLIVNYSLALLRLHISKNKKNLGTLTAFGYNNTKITGLYLNISMVLLFLTFGFAYLITNFLGDYIFSLVLSMVNANVAADALHFEPLNIGIALGVFIALPLVLISLQIYRLLKLSPGDLVYDRKTE
jgi:hypothetical protein